MNLTEFPINATNETVITVIGYTVNECVQLVQQANYSFLSVYVILALLVTFCLTLAEEKGKLRVGVVRTWSIAHMTIIAIYTMLKFLGYISSI